MIFSHLFGGNRDDVEEGCWQVSEGRVSCGWSCAFLPWATLLLQHHRVPTHMGSECVHTHPERTYWPSALPYPPWHLCHRGSSSWVLFCILRVPRFLQQKAKKDPVSLNDPLPFAPQASAPSIPYPALSSLLRGLLSSLAEFVSRERGGECMPNQTASPQCLYLSFWCSPSWSYRHYFYLKRASDGSFSSVIKTLSSTFWPSANFIFLKHRAKQKAPLLHHPPNHHPRDKDDEGGDDVMCLMALRVLVPHKISHWCTTFRPLLLSPYCRWGAKAQEE